MTIAAAVQMEPAFGQSQRNVQTALDLIEASPPANLYVLPELFHCGYVFTSQEEAAALAEPVDGPTVSALQQASAERQCTIFAGLAERDDQTIYNSSVLIDQGQVLGTYRKIHLFDKETLWFTPGAAPPPVYQTSSGRLGLMICFDWIFPETARSLMLNGAQILCHSANLVLQWCQKATVTRCVENHVYTVLANRIGTESRGGDTLTFTGASTIVDPNGQVQAAAPEAKATVITAEIDPALADDKTIGPSKINNLLRDRKPDLYFQQ